MKKLLALLLTLTLSLGLLAGCGGPSEPAPEEEPTSAQSGNRGQRRPAKDYLHGTNRAAITGAYLAQTLGYFAEEGPGRGIPDHQGGDATTAVFVRGRPVLPEGHRDRPLMVNEAGQGCKVILSATQKYPLPADRRQRVVLHP